MIINNELQNLNASKPKRFHDHQEVVDRAKRRLLADEQIFSLAELFSMLADPSKLKILLALHDEEMCVCALADLLQVSESAVSHQLRLLKSLKLVEFRKAGRTVYYKLNDHNDIHWLLDFCDSHRTN